MTPVSVPDGYIEQTKNTMFVEILGRCVEARRRQRPHESGGAVKEDIAARWGSKGAALMRQTSSLWLRSQAATSHYSLYAEPFTMGNAKAKP